MNRRLDPNESFNEIVLTVLDELKKESIATPDDERVFYSCTSSERLPSVIDQRRALQFLQKEKAIEIIKEKFPLNMMSITADFIDIKPSGYYIDILQPNFDKMLESIRNGSPMLYFEKMDRAKGILYFAGTEIVISKGGKETFAIQLLDTLQKSPGQFLFEDEILTDWGYADEEQKELPKNRVYHAALKANEEVQKATRVTDFIEHTTDKFRINPTYLKSS